MPIMRKVYSASDKVRFDLTANLKSLSTCSNYMILDDFISGCMRIYCMSQECISNEPWRVGYTFLTSVRLHIPLSHRPAHPSFSHRPAHPSLFGVNWWPFICSYFTVFKNSSYFSRFRNFILSYSCYCLCGARILTRLNNVYCLVNVQILLHNLNS